MNILLHDNHGMPRSAAVATDRWLALTTLGCGVALLLLQSGCAGSRPVERPPGVLYLAVDPNSHPAFPAAVHEAAASAPLEVTLDPAAAASSDYRLDLRFSVRDKGISDTETIWTMTTVILLTMYPSTCGRVELSLDGDLYDAAGKRLKSWSIVENDTAFLWLFQGKDCFGEPAAESIEKAASKMLGQLYARMSGDGVFTGGSMEPVDKQPLVYVDAADTQVFVEKILRTDAPFPNFTTDPIFSDMASRVIKIRFEFTSPELTIGGVLARTAGAIMTIGLVSQCPKSRMTLNAQVFAADTNLLREYQYVAKKRVSLANDCAPVTDATHPDVAAKLLRKLLKQIEKDKLV